MEVDSKKKKLPTFGIGPVYVGSCLALTLGGGYLAYRGVLWAGDLSILRLPLYILGGLLVIEGVLLWLYAVVFQRFNEQLKANTLVTTGAYYFVRNPIYSAFALLLTGVLMFFCNGFLLILPFVFWLLMTVMLKKTEEKWLIDAFGEEYIAYMKRVNRVIPWFPKKDKSLEK